ncbi:hypothetical protein BC938DRAFT_474546 [Jimgerdemannia flammicorona]|uniref:Aminoacyl-tRNA synthetase class I anticodon-binding domain-containing protein n=1 Tax=Jimgerdemannia flammicorona TaxID=994334 RepID=A0A433Q237_9FUNG|nr:hypothetical protein BC938DRAFT_474546 [Jimgerdemannia flammicorona]
MVSTDKLDWINKQHLAWRTDSAEGMRSLVEMLRPMIGERLHGSGNNALLEDVYLVSVISTIKERIRNIADIPVLCGYFFVEPDYASAESLELRNKLGEDALKTILTPAMALLSAIPPTNFSAATVKDALHAFANDAGLKFNQVMMVTRYAVTGIKIGAGVAETMEVLGRETCLRRMEAVVGGTGM